MAVASEVVVRLVAKTKKFEGDMNRSSKAVGGLRKGASSAGAGLLKMAGPLAAAGTAAGAAALLFRGFTGAFKELDQIGKVSDKLGIATEQLIGLQFAAKNTGVSANTLNTALQRMVRRVSEAGKGLGQTGKALKELGLNAKQLAKLAPDQQFRKIAEAMKGVATQGDRVRLAMALFDTEGVALVNTLALGSEGLNRFQKDAEDLGLTVGRDQVAAIEKADEAITRLGASWDGAMRQMAASTAPVVEGIAKLLDKANLVDLGIVAKTRQFVRAQFEEPEPTKSERQIRQEKHRDRLLARVRPGQRPEDIAARAANVASATAPLEAMNRVLQDQIAFFGHGADAAKLFHLSIKAGDDAELRAIINQIRERQKVLDQLKKVEEFHKQTDARVKRERAATERAAKAQKAADAAAGEAIFQQTRTPFERFLAKILDLKKLLAKGVIDDDVFNRAIKNAEDNLKRAEGKGIEKDLTTGLVASPQALERGTAAAFSAVNQSRRETPQLKVAKEQLEEAKEQLEEAKKQEKTMERVEKIMAKIENKLEPVGFN